MPALPPITDFTGGAVTEGQFKTALAALHSYLSTLLGSAGTQAAGLAALGALGAGYSLKTSAYSITAADRGKVIAGDSTFALTLPDAGTVGAGWSVVAANVGVGVVTVSGVQDINGEPSLDLGSYDSVLITCTGIEWLAVGGGAQRVQIDRVEPAGQAGSSGALTIPPWARYAIVTLQGGGGSSGLDAGGVTVYPGGAGGRGGVRWRAVVPVASGETSAAYTVGAGGTSGGGQASSFSIGATSVTAPGGSGGSNASGSIPGSAGANGADTALGVIAASALRYNGAAAGSGTTVARGQGAAGRLEVEWR